MSLNTPSQSITLPADILSIAKEKLSSKENASFAPFIPLFFSDTEPEALSSYPAEHLFGAAFSLYSLAQQRKDDQISVRLYNPDLEAHGWQSAHTAIEIIQDDTPFLVDSISMLLLRYGLNLHLMIHPILTVQRDSQGKLQHIKNTDKDESNLSRESFIHIQIDRVTDVQLLQKLENDLTQMLNELHQIVNDEQMMRDRLNNTRQQLETYSTDSTNEDVTFLQWLNSGNFLFMGTGDFVFPQQTSQKTLQVVPNSLLGMLKKHTESTIHRLFDTQPLENTLTPAPSIILCKSQLRSDIHRPAYLDIVCVSLYNEQGKVIGKRQFIGLYTAHAYHESPTAIPIMRQKIADVVKNCQYVENGYKAKTLNFVLETYPRDELFEISTEQLTPIAQGIVNLQERPRVRLFVRKDIYQRYVSCLVYIPRDAFDPDIRQKIETVLAKAFNGYQTEMSMQVSDFALARIHYIVRIKDHHLPNFDTELLETEIAHLVRGWTDDLKQALFEMHGEEYGNILFNRYKNSFDTVYQASFSARTAALDIQQLETITDENIVAMKMYRPFNHSASAFNLKLFRNKEALDLSVSLPILENMGVNVRDEHLYPISRADGSVVWISDFGLDAGNAHEQIESKEIQDTFQELLLHILTKQCENDVFNRLALLAGLNWREISLIRALARFLRQGGLTFSLSYIGRCVANYPSITRHLVAVFKARLDPESQQDENTLLAQLREEMNKVANLDEDRILNGFLSVILATLRTNFWQKDSAGQNKPYIAFKLESNTIPFLPQPRPLYEIWVYSPRFEGTHLRGSKVARGGLRWSDRLEDFRTEVLGLLKAQMVKNSVIVPMGSKGGFICKQLPPASEREAWLSEGKACYQLFISGLLDLTDNLVSGKITPPAQVKRRDNDDPYLVVAADKGTATFSDLANSLSAQYHFWLSDAFASGGSAGYDHKGIGITARGAWESAKRHFRHLNVNIQEEDFTAVGIGDMSGDVFGNGMLCSKHTRLKAAFNHLHIFIDPNPDAAISYQERERLFKLPRSSWSDYNPELISSGGGVFERTAKSIPLSAEVKAWLQTDQEHMAPNDLIRALLTAKIDLIYNGGIGTYIKASTETHADVRDRANDPVRVNGRDVQAKVVVEGGNLSCTQLGRIEFALKGGLICTDAIDNSAGVDCSDHEVNIKILLGAVIQAGDMTLKQRNELLVSMTNEVAQLVLRNNILQTQVLAIKRQEALSLLTIHANMIAHLEKTGELDREIEYLPSESQISERRAIRQGLTTPELAVLMAYSKMSLDRQLLATNIPDNPDFVPVLVNYFPKPLQERFAKQMLHHRLKREIIANQLANYMINRMGITYVFRLQQETSFTLEEITRAWWTSVHVLNAEQWWQQIEALSNLIPADQQSALMELVRLLVEDMAHWFLLHAHPSASINECIGQYAKPVQNLLMKLPSLIPTNTYPDVAKREEALTQPGIPQSLQQVLARVEYAVSLLDILEIQRNYSLGIEQVAANYFLLGNVLKLDWLSEAIAKLPSENRWQALARSALRDDLFGLHRQLAHQALQEGQSNTEFAKQWLEKQHVSVNACQKILAEIMAYETVDLAMLSAVMRELRQHLLG